MLKIILFSVIIFFQVSKEQYHIIHIKGNISSKATGKPYKVGDKLSADDQVKFMTADAAAVLISTQRGRFTIKAQPASTSANSSEMVAFVKNVVLPLKSNGNLSTRGAESADGEIDLKGYLGMSKYAIVGDYHHIKLNTGKYPMNDTKYFIYRYLYEGKTVSKKIGHSGDQLILDYNTLYNVNEKMIPSEKIDKVDIYYGDAKTKNFTLITSFSPLFLKESVLTEELTSQRNFYKSQDYSEIMIKNEVASFVTDVYGKTDKDILLKWIDANVK